MKKLFSWILALALVLTIMPVLGVHNHAEAAEGKACGNYNCSCTMYDYDEDYFVNKSYGLTSTDKNAYCTCRHTNSKHTRDACDHEGQDDGNCLTGVVCSKCGTKILVQAKEAHEPGADDGNCTTPILCSNPGCTKIAKDGFAHTRENDGDCTTPDDCSVCGMEDVFAAGTHTPYEDDGDCTTPILCKICDNVFTAAKTHIAAADDGDCTTPILCANTGCEEVMTAGKAAHTPKADDGDCTTAVYCADCDKVAIPAAASHTPKADDGDCSTPVECSVCGKVTTEAASTHNLVNGECTNCEYKCNHTATTKTTTKEANCKYEGTEVETCDACGVVVGTEALPVDEDNHDWVVFPFGAGYCNRCGEINVNYDDFEDVLPDEDAPIENPCEEHQWAYLEFGAWYCTKCGASATDIKPLEPEVCDHADTYIEVVEAATCKKEGSAKEICDICEEVLDENVVLPIDKENGHDWVVFPFGAGWCNRCSEINVNYDDFIKPEDPTCEHDWAQVGPGWYCWKCNGVTLDEPAEPEVPEEEEVCEEHQWATLGFGAWYCLKCGATATDIKPLEPEKCDHADTYIDVIDAATCVAEGLGNKVCDICETLLEEGVVLPIDKENGHKWTEDKDGNEYCELCQEPNTEVPEEPCEHEWLQVATGWFCGKCGEVTLEDPNAEPEYAIGDINMDGVIDGRDEVRLMKYLVGQNVEVNLKAADVNGDGTIDGRDEVRLMKMLVG